jgi:hypothetical protein
MDDSVCNANAYILECLGHRYVDFLLQFLLPRMLWVLFLLSLKISSLICSTSVGVTGLVSSISLFKVCWLILGAAILASSSVTSAV